MIAFFIVALKFVSKRLNPDGSFDLFLLKIHKPAGAVMIIAGLSHVVLSAWSIPVIGIVPYVIGIVSISSCIAAVVFYAVKDKLSSPIAWIKYHHLFTLITIITIIGHIAAARARH